MSLPPPEPSPLPPPATPPLPPVTPPLPTQNLIPAQAPIQGDDLVRRDEVQHMVAGTMDLVQKYAELTGQISLLRSQIDTLQGSVDALDAEVATMQEQAVPHG